MWMRDNWALGWRYFSIRGVIPTFDSEGQLKKNKKNWATCCSSPVLVFLVQKQHMNGVVSEEAFFSFCASNLFLNPPIQSSAPWTGLMLVSSLSTLTVINTFWGRFWLANEFTKCFRIQNVKCCEQMGNSGQEQPNRKTRLRSTRC